VNAVRRTWGRVAGLVALGAVIALVAGCGSGHEVTVTPTITVVMTHSTTRTSTRTTTRTATRTVAPTTTANGLRGQRRGWLGLNYNSSTGIGAIDTFASAGIVYDRAGRLVPNAGVLPRPGTQFGNGLAASVAAGMIPIVVVDPSVGPLGCSGDPNASTLCVPVSQHDVDAFVRGFIATARASRALYPNQRILFEPMNEPWNFPFPPGSQSGRRGAAEYAAILAKLLPAARAAGIPLADIYVPGDGAEQDGSRWIRDIYQAQPCLAPGRGTCGPIEGWNLHPYGLPGRTDQGIGTVPAMRADMRSGADNVIISEIGFCSTEVDNRVGCDQNSPVLDGSNAQVVAWLGQTLKAAARMHRAGWLRGFLLWNRGPDAWGMQTASGQLTPQGRELAAFAASADG
jgi:hypothetical protein